MAYLINTIIVLGLVALFLIAIKVLKQWGRSFQQYIRKPKDEWIVDDRGITLIATNTRSQMLWNELEEVAIITTEGGPLVDDFFWVLRDEKLLFTIPLPAATEMGLLKFLQKLPGFDNNGVVKAIGGLKNATFRCWEKQNTV